ncbi:MAG: hypothetical protein MUF54_24545 [Polyangiaceae bacterium]|jgi:hypothetical protein|nr:hypothetical protein [Polyangiaceae bacterium]
MKHVFVESNWVYDYCSPRHLRKPDAENLAGRAANGGIVLHVPGICLREGASSVRRKSQPKDADIKEFRRWAAQAGEITPEDATAAVRFLDRYRLRITTDLNDINARLDALVASPGVEAFGLNEAMLQRVLRLRGTVPEDADLKPFDEAILGAVVVRAEELRGAGERDFWFCTLDSDLWPWTKDKTRRPGLERLYRDAGFVDTQGEITVRSDLLVP